MPPSTQQALGNKKSILALLQDVTTEGLKFEHDEPEARERLIEKARSLIRSLETPMESILWMIWSEPTRNLAARLALDLKIFETLTQDDRPRSLAELAAPTGASPKLVKRIAQKLATMQMIDETEVVDEYVSNSFTQALTVPKYRDGIRFCAWPSFTHMPGYLSETKFQNPEDFNDGPFQYANNDKSLAAWLNENPRVFEAFHNYVHGQREDRPAWTDEGFYPVHQRLIEGLQLEGDSSALVDVGGGMGHVLSDFIADVPEWQGRLVLQEQDPVLQVAKASGVSPRIETMVHDFFTAQPIKGARAYYMRYVLHDWSDDNCRKILGQIKDVMEPGYSKILINECVVADRDPSWQHASLDLFMMALTASRERSQKEWQDLMHSCGLKIAGIWSKGQGNESLIEVVL